MAVPLAHLSLKNMTKKEFIELTGEDPMDVFGADWENELDRYKVCEKCSGELGKKIVGDEYYDYCRGCNWVTH